MSHASTPDLHLGPHGMGTGIAIKGVEANSLAADPGFIDLAGDDYRFADGSPARGRGIAPVDISQAGLQGDADTFPAS